MVSPLNRAAQFLNPGLEGSRAWERAGWDALSAPVIRSIMASLEGSPATKKKALAAPKGVSRSAWEMGLLETEDYQRIRGIKGPRGGGEFTSRHIHMEEINALIETCSRENTSTAKRDTALVWFAHATGARRAELASLRLGNIEQNGSRLKIDICGKVNASGRFMWRQPRR
jgi:integrase